MNPLALVLVYATIGVLFAIAVGRTLEYSGSEHIAFGVGMTLIAWPMLLLLMLGAAAVDGLARLLGYDG